MVTPGSTMRRALQRVGALMVAAACGGGDTAPGPIPTIEGYYLGTWTLAVQGDRVDCPAALTISDQVDSTFSTSLEVRRRYAPGVGCLDTIEPGVGSVRATGTINALAELVEPQTCTLKEPNVGLTGKVVDDSVRLSGRYTYRCPQEAVWTLTFAGSTNGAPLPAYQDVTGDFSGTYTTLVPGGVQVDCPVTVSLATQVRDDVAGSYELGGGGSCRAQSPEALSGVVTIDGYLELSGVPPTPLGCSVWRPLVVAGGITSDTLMVGGTFRLLCGSTLREFGVVISAVRTSS